LSDKVAVAMSGGVDSSIAAAMLKDQGHEVVGIGLRMFGEAGAADAPADRRGVEEMEDARGVAEAIGIPFHVLDFTDPFREKVIDPFVSSYAEGETPNPCIPCNQVIKFGLLLRAAEGMGARYLATGHYARVERDAETGRYMLARGVDGMKDQSYFLYALSQEQLARALFPMGDMTKARARAMAAELGFKVHDKRGSQDICFVGAEGYASYVCRQPGVSFEPGPILDEAGSVIGTHRGLPHYTVGQRRGLGISLPEPVYVVDIDPGANSVTVVTGDRLRRQDRVLLDCINYVSIERPARPVEAQARTRYRKPEVPAMFVPVDERRALVEFHEPQEPTAPGQSVVLYDGDNVLCGGVVKRELS
jgi:tRNA-specific 2-thiouridylase